MKTPKEVRIFETQNAGLASFLILHDVKLIEFKKDEVKRNIVTMRFMDEKQNCLDLERVFLNSEHKKYIDIYKYLLTKVHETKRS
jgi:hypothetical protein